MIILGIDPGSQITGFGVIAVEANKPRHLHSGCIRVQGALTQRLFAIHQQLQQIMETYQPDQAAIEQIFMAKYAQAAMMLGHARGVAVVAVATYDIPLSEYAPRRVKQAVVGYGAAEKTQVQRMIGALLSLSELPAPDAADALAIALCHAYTTATAARLQQAVEVI